MLRSLLRKRRLKEFSALRGNPLDLKERTMTMTYADGYANGHDDGYDDGYDAGYAQGLRDAARKAPKTWNEILNEALVNPLEDFVARRDAAEGVWVLIQEEREVRVKVER
jgi:flagellar biosynthesis/type III secretory pathway protein FliH